MLEDTDGLLVHDRIWDNTFDPDATLIFTMRYAVLASRRFAGKRRQQLAEEPEREREERLEAQRRVEQLE